ncbi:MAG: GIY-YIG nuclease family protein [Candidatus Sericytochromatia bacterium]
MKKEYYIYFMANNNNKCLYIGVTNNIERRVLEHKTNLNKSFTSKYKCYKLVYTEIFYKIEEAILREKQLKKWKREWKNLLVSQINPNWDDLYFNL